MLPRSFAVARLLVVPLLLACTASSPKPSDSADINAINTIREKEMSSFRAGAIDSNLALIATNAVMLPPDQDAVEGPDALRKWFSDVAANYTVGGGYTDAKVSVVGDVAIERYTGTLTLTPKAGGNMIEQRVKGIHIYRRQPDGSWKLSDDIWNAVAPPAPAAKQ